MLGEIEHEGCTQTHTHTHTTHRLSDEETAKKTNREQPEIEIMLLFVR